MAAAWPCADRGGESRSVGRGAASSAEETRDEQTDLDLLLNHVPRRPSHARVRPYDRSGPIGSGDFRDPDGSVVRQRCVSWSTRAGRRPAARSVHAASLVAVVGVRSRSLWKRGAGVCTVAWSWVGSRAGLPRRKLSGFWPRCSSSAPWSMPRLGTGPPRSSRLCWRSPSICGPGRAGRVSGLIRGRADEVHAVAEPGAFLSSTARVDIRSGPGAPSWGHRPVNPEPTSRTENPRSAGHMAHVVVPRNAISATGRDVEASAGRSAPSSRTS